MSRRANPMLIGAFVLGAVAIALAGLVAFGGGKLFRSKITYVAYFEGSVSGLVVGAAVEFRGVRIGSVSKIDVRVNTQDASVRIPVYLDLEQNRVTRIGGQVGPGAILTELIEQRGLKAQLQTQSLVTGQLVVNLDFHPEFETRTVRADPDFPEMPTIPTNLQQIEQTVREALAKLSTLPLEELVRDLQRGVHGFSDLINSPELERALVNANQTLEDLQSLVEKVDGSVDPLAAGAEDTLAQAQRTLRSFEVAVADDSPLGSELARALGELAAAARSVRVLAEYIERHPDAIVRGKGSAGGR